MSQPSRVETVSSARKLPSSAPVAETAGKHFVVGPVDAPSAVRETHSRPTTNDSVGVLKRIPAGTRSVRPSRSSAVNVPNGSTVRSGSAVRCYTPASARP